MSAGAPPDVLRAMLAVLDIVVNGSEAENRELRKAIAALEARKAKPAKP